MRLSNLIPSVPAELVASLEACGIRTESDLLSLGSPFDVFRRLPAGTISLKELTDYIDLVAELCAAPGLSSLHLLRIEQAHSEDNRLSSGNAELDKFLCGLGGQIIEISGDKGSGKSVLALNLVLHHLSANLEITAVWIDTTGDFLAERAIQALSVSKTSTRLLERLQVSLAFDIDAAQALLVDLCQTSNLPQLLIIDSVTPLLGPLLSAVSAQGHALMSNFMHQLRTFAQTYGITVLVINDTASKGPNTSERKPALGPSFALMSDTTLWLQSIQNAGTNTILHSVQVLRSRSKASGSYLLFGIDSNVIYSV